MNSIKFITRKYSIISGKENSQDINIFYKNSITDILQSNTVTFKNLILTYVTKVTSSNGIVYVPTPAPKNMVVDNILKTLTFTPVTNTSIEDYEYQIIFDIGEVDNTLKSFRFTPTSGKKIEDYEIF